MWSKLPWLFIKAYELKCQGAIPFGLRDYLMRYCGKELNRFFVSALFTQGTKAFLREPDLISDFHVGTVLFLQCFQLHLQGSGGPTSPSTMTQSCSVSIQHAPGITEFGHLMKNWLPQRPSWWSMILCRF